MFEHPVAVSILLVMIVIMVFGVFDIIKFNRQTKKLRAKNLAKRARDQSAQPG